MITHSKDNGLQKPIAKAHGLVLLYSHASRYSPWGYITFLSLICWPTSGISQDSPCLNTKQKTLGPMWLLQWSLLRSLIESWWRFSNLCTQLGNTDLTHAVCQSLHSHAQCIRLIIGIGFYPALSSHFPKRAVLPSTSGTAMSGAGANLSCCSAWEDGPAWLFHLSPFVTYSVLWGKSRKSSKTCVQKKRNPQKSFFLYSFST